MVFSKENTFRSEEKIVRSKENTFRSKEIIVRSKEKSQVSLVLFYKSF